MRSENRLVEARIRRLTREIAKIDESTYAMNERSDRELYAAMLERKRDDRVRSAVLQLHTAIEDVLTSWIECRILGIPMESRRRARSKAARALSRVLRDGGSIGFEMKLNIALALRLINGSVKHRLTTLNQLRNRCSHNWLLKVPMRRGKRPRQKKPPLLFYRGGDLHSVEVLESFLGEYGPLYAVLFSKYLSWTP